MIVKECFDFGAAACRLAAQTSRALQFSALKGRGASFLLPAELLCVGRFVIPRWKVAAIQQVQKLARRLTKSGNQDAGQTLSQFRVYKSSVLEHTA